MSRPWARDLDTDFAALHAWGASALVTLMECHELVHFGVSGLGKHVQATGLCLYHLPIRDGSIPTPEFEAQWRTTGQVLRERLLGGQSLVVHFRRGLGRTGLLAACPLIELGESPETALQRVRAVRPGAVETREQEIVGVGMRRSRLQLKGARRPAIRAQLASQTRSRRTVAGVVPQKRTCSARARCDSRAFPPASVRLLGMTRRRRGGNILAGAVARIIQALIP